MSNSVKMVGSNVFLVYTMGSVFPVISLNVLFSKDCALKSHANFLTFSCSSGSEGILALVKMN